MHRLFCSLGLVLVTSGIAQAQFERDDPAPTNRSAPVITPNPTGPKVLRPATPPPALPAAPSPNADPNGARSNRFESDAEQPPGAPLTTDPNNARRSVPTLPGAPGIPNLPGAPSGPMLAPPPFGPNAPANPRLGPDEPFVYANDLGIWKIAPAYRGKVAGKASYRWFDGETYVDRLEFLAYGRVIDYADAGIATGTRVPVWAYRGYDEAGNQIYFYFGVEAIQTTPMIRRGERYFPMYYSYDPPNVAQPERLLTVSGTKRL